MVSAVQGLFLSWIKIRYSTLHCELQSNYRSMDVPKTILRAIACSIFNIVDDRTLASLVTGSVLSALGSPTLLCILGSRMFFNLKEAGEHGVNVGTNWASYSHSAIQFDDAHPNKSG